MDDVLHNTPDVAIALREVEVAQTGGRFIVMGMRLELDKRDRNVSVLQLYGPIN